VDWVVIAAVALVASGAMSAVLLYERHLLRQHVFLLLRWIDDSLGGNGHISSIRWVGNRELEVPIKLRTGNLNKAHFAITVPPSLLTSKLRSTLRKPTSTTLEFRADFETKPAFSVDIQTLRWFARSRKDLDTEASGWVFEAATPVVLTTKLDWEKEIKCAFQALLSSNRQCGLDLRFQRRSPHLRASFEVDCAEQPKQLGQPFFSTLLSVVSGVSAKAS
jgi:hypothetical protein